MAKNIGLNLWIIIGLVAVALLITQTSFFGAIVTTCDLQEPESLPELVHAIDSVGGVINQVEDFSITGMEFDTYRLTIPDVYSNIYASYTGVIYCGFVLSELKINGGEQINTRPVVLYNGGYYFCNEEGNMLFQVEDLGDIDGYIDFFTFCEEEVVPDYVTDGAECILGNGTIEDDKCMCPDGSRLLINETCPPPPEYIEEALLCQVVDGNFTSGFCYCGEFKLELGMVCNQPEEVEEPEPVAAPTPTPTPAVNVTAPPLDDEKENIKNMYYVIAILVLFILYWIYERGPKKGLFKG